MRRRTKRPGFVLLMTLVLIALTGFLLAGLARHSISLALQAIEKESELQLHWGTISCRRVMFDDPRALLSEKKANEGEQDSDDDDDKEATPIARRSIRITLGSIDYNLLLADENAKLNLNLLLAHEDIQHAHQIVRELSNAPSDVIIRLRPYRNTAIRGATPMVESWGQVFQLRRSRGDAEQANRFQAVTNNITCWGRGRLNFTTASDESLKAACRLVIPDNAANQLVEIRREQPDVEISDALSELGLATSKRNALEAILTDHSSCYSLWITATTAQRSWHELRVTNGGGAAGNYDFSW